MDQINHKQPKFEQPDAEPGASTEIEDTSVSAGGDAAASPPAGPYDLVDAVDTSAPTSDSSMSIGILIGVAVVLALLLMLVFGAGNDGGAGEDTGGSDGIIALPTPGQGAATATVTAARGANVRTGPGTTYDIVGVLVQGTVAQVTGRGQDGAWWVLNVPQAPNNQGWVSADLLDVQNADGVPVIVPPDAGQPAPVIVFGADSTTLAPGECTTLRWQTENVSEVYVYASGDPWQSFPVIGNGSQEVCPGSTTVYEMRVFLPDGSVETRRLQIEVTDVPVADPLSGTSWRLEALYTNQVPVPDSSIDLSFRDGEASGSSGCNRYTGPYRVDGAALSFGLFASTQRACTPEIDQQEQLYLQTLTTTASFQSDGTQLLLLDAGGQEIARYRALRDQ